MNRWLLTIAGVAAAGSALAANTKPAPKANPPRRTASARVAPAAPASATPVTPSRPVAVAAAPAAEAPSSTPPVVAPAPAADAPAKPKADVAPAEPKPVIVEDLDVVIRRPGTEIEVEEEVEIDVADPNTGKKLLRQRFTDAPFLAYGLSMRSPDALQKSVSVDINDARPKDALEEVVKQAGGNINLVFDKDAPNDARITLKVKQVSAATLVGLIAQNAGLDWNVNVNQNGDKQTTELRISKGGSGPRISFTGPRDVNPAIPPIANIYSGLGDFVTTRKMVVGEQRLSLECPHCKVKSTIIRQRSQPKCAKCARTFQNDWQFCPADGTKRPADPNEWKFCPSCGKKIEIEKASIEEGVPFLSDLPIVGELFRHNANSFNPNAFPKGPEGYAVPAVPGYQGFHPRPNPTPSTPRGRFVPAPPAKPGAAPASTKGPAAPVPTRPAAPPAAVQPVAPPVPTPTVPAPAPAPEPVEVPAK